MKRWLPRSLCLLAWSFWAWLGFGLYRELPRDFGPVVAQMPEYDQSLTLGFVGDTNLVLVGPAKRDKREKTSEEVRLQLIDAEAGGVVGERIVPAPYLAVGDRTLPLGPGSGLALFDALGREGMDDLLTLMRQGVLLSVTPDSEALQALDVLTGEWRRISRWPVAYVAPHPAKPWAAVVDLEPGSPPPARVVVVDLKSGKKLFRRDLPLGTKLEIRPFFFPARNQVVLPLLIPPSKSTDLWRAVHEVWTVADPPILETTVDDFEATGFRATAAANRMYWQGRYQYEGSRLTYVDVYDFQARRFLTTLPVAERPEANGGKHDFSKGLVEPAIAPSGRSVLRYGPMTTRTESSGNSVITIGKPALYEVGTGRLLWQERPDERLIGVYRDRFLINEQWESLWKQWLPSVNFRTVAWRSLETGAVLFRTSAKTLINPRRCNAAETLFVHSNGAVYRMPLRVNWPLLALCQTILALPLILLWAVLRWRRKRKLRLASLTP